MKGISLFTAQHKPTTSERSDIVDFLFYFARHLYERMGFTQPYLEMRYKAES